jgi:hypothetical protein
MEISLKRLLSLSQIDKIILTLIATCLLPFLVHTLPFFKAINLGQIWLPIFYAPLIAGLCFSPHVALIAGLCAPSINHILFNLPDDYGVRVLTFELLIFNAALAIIKRQTRLSGLQIVSIYAVTRLLTSALFGYPTNAIFINYFFQSMAASFPGLVMLWLLAEIVNHWRKEKL